MLWNEFIEGTGCKDTEKNYEVYKNLEIMYMNSDMSKAEIYEYGKKLVDNSKSEKEIEFENEIKAEIADLKEEIESWKRGMEYAVDSLNYWKQDGDKEMIRRYKDSVACYKSEIKEMKARINSLKWVLA